jgi:hypothetical protein
MKTYEQEVTQPVAVGNPSGRPDLHTPQAGLGVPLGRAAITGFLISAVISTLIYICGVSILDLAPWSLLIFLMATTAAWLYFQLNLLSLEQLTGIDWNRNGKIDKPAKEVVRPVRVDVHRYENGKHTETVRAHFPNEARIISLADAILNKHIPFTQKALVEEYKILKRAELDEIIEVAEQRGLIYKKYQGVKNSPYETTDDFKQTLADFLKPPHSPTA